MNFFKLFNRNNTTIPTAEETRKAVAKKLDKQYDNLRIEIGTWFRNGNHPYDNLSRACEHIHVPHYRNNDSIDYLKPELEALGYEVLERAYEVRHYTTYTHTEYTAHNISYRVIKIK